MHFQPLFSPPPPSCALFPEERFSIFAWECWMGFSKTSTSCSSLPPPPQPLPIQTSPDYQKHGDWWCKLLYELYVRCYQLLMWSRMKQTETPPLISESNLLTALLKLASPDHILSSRRCWKPNLTSSGIQPPRQVNSKHPQSKVVFLLLLLIPVWARQHATQGAACDATGYIVMWRYHSTTFSAVLEIV